MVTRLASFITVSLLVYCCAARVFAGGTPRAQGDQAEIQRNWQEARRALAAKDLNAAAAAFEKLRVLTPDVPEVEMNLGNIYYVEGRYDKAADAFQRAVKLNPKIPDGTLMVALCDVELGNWERARPALESGFRHPPNPEAGRVIGIKLTGIYWSLHESSKALQVSEELLQRYPGDPEILYRAIHSYDARGGEIMNALVHVAPGSPWEHMALGENLEGSENYDLAIIEYRKVIAADPGIPGVHYRLGKTLLLNGLELDSQRAQDEALKEFQAAVAVNPLDAGAEYEIGGVYWRRGDQKQAYGHFLRATEIDPGFEEAQIAVARALIAEGKSREAIPHLRAAISLNSANEVSHFLLAKAYKSLGDQTGSEHEMALFSECHKRAVQEGLTLANAGGAHRNKGQVPSTVSAPAATKQTLGPEEGP